MDFRTVWASFLGFGYLQEMFIIPNANVFLGDVISSTNLEKKRMYSVSEFVDAIMPMANIVISDIAAKKFNYEQSKPKDEVVLFIRRSDNTLVRIEG